MPTSWNPVTRRALFAALLALLVTPFAGLAGCGDSPEQKAIRANWKRYYFAVQQGASLDYHDLISSGTVKMYDRLVPLAAKGAKSDIAALAPAEKHELIIMRNRVPLAKLKTMDGRAYVLHAISEHFWTSLDDEFDPNDDAGPWKFAKIVVNGNTAVAEYAVSIDFGDDQPTYGRRRRRQEVHVEKSQMFFVKEDGAWRVDEVAMIPGTNKAISEAARGTTIDKFLIDVEADDTGKPVREDIFDKPPR